MNGCLSYSCCTCPDYGICDKTAFEALESTWNGTPIVAEEGIEYDRD